jgi:co-chaperonin GroES (HSP10)
MSAVLQHIDARTKRERFIDEHFPSVPYGGKPPGAYILVQLRMVRTKTSGGIFLSDETRDFNRSQTCLGILRETGPIAFKNRETGQPWPEGVWAKTGDLVMVRRHEGRRFEVPIPSTEERALFVVLSDNNLDWVVDADFQDLDKLYDQII